MTYALLTLTQYNHAREAICPKRDWWGKDTGTTCYCGEGMPDIHGVYYFPLVDPAATAFVQGLYPDAELTDEPPVFPQPESTES